MALSKRTPRRSKGFTLIEVIAVSVIVAVLAAVAIPIYTAYVRSSRQASVDQLAQTASAAANGYYRKTGADPVLADLNLFFDQGEFAVVVNPPNITVTMIQHPAFTKSVPYR